jgi:GMP synthase (glutamine-hydrolysing)
MHILYLLVAIEHESRKLYGVQFHPEVDLTVNGAAMIKNFLYGVRKYIYFFNMPS